MTGGVEEEDAANAEVVTCSDWTRYSLVLPAGRDRVFPVEIGAEARLVLTGCSEAQSGNLAVSIESDDVGHHETRPLHAGLGWQRWELDLARLEGESVRVRLAFEGPTEAQAFLTDAFLEHRPEERSGASRRESGLESPAQILLISIDTLRADTANELPTLSALAQEAEYFSDHIATASWTKPSHAGLLTGYPAGVHGAFLDEAPIHPAVPTLAERFQAAGFDTLGLVYDSIWLRSKFGFDRGFQSYSSVRWTPAQVARHAGNWIADHRDQPFFFFFHTFEPHSDFARLPYEGPGVTAEMAGAWLGGPAYGCRGRVCASGMLNGMKEGQYAPVEGEQEVLQRLYRIGSLAVDEEMGRFFEILRGNGLWNDLLVVVTSDHGEMLLEHGTTLHGHLWEEVLRVPLLIKWPKNERVGVRSERTSAIDLAPTLLRFAGLEGEGLPGRDLRRRHRQDRPVFAGGRGVAVYRGELKGIFAPDIPAKLFDLATDSRESVDLALQRVEEMASLEALAREQRNEERRILRQLEATSERKEERDTKLTGEERERLRALGYLGED